jgi:N-acyl-D-amino-acid deacylase
MVRTLVLLFMVTSCHLVHAEDERGVKPSPNVKLPPESVRAAIGKAIPLLQQGASVSANERKCFTCHNQALPVFVLAEAAKQDFEIDKQVLQQQLQHTWNHLNGGKSGYLTGKGQGGQVMTAGYAMWALEMGEWRADETTTAVAHYLIEYQRDKNRWVGNSKRPPSSGSGFTATYLALRALSHYGSAEQQDGIKARREAVAKWVLETNPEDTEDRVFRLRSLPYIDADPAIVQQAIDALLAKQDASGGWSQADDMQPDAYATGTVLAALQEVGQLSSEHPAVVSGCRYLIDSQREDGTWHVATRAKPIQEYYESGFPHDVDQFISITATAWATLALARTLPAAHAE